MKKNNKLLYMILVMVVIISIIPSQAYASECDFSNSIESEVLENKLGFVTKSSNIADRNEFDSIVNSEYFYEGPSVEFNLSNENNYTDTIKTRGISGVTVVSCSLSGHTGGVDGLYQIIIHWNGNNRVKSLSANKLYINNGNILSPKTYSSKGFSIDCKSTYTGYRVIGTCYIPKEVKSVRVSSKILQAYFNDRDYWLRLNEIYGTINL